MDPWLYNHTRLGLQTVEQEDTLYAVENHPVDARRSLRMEAPFGRLVRYSAGAPLVLEGVEALGLEAAGQRGFRLLYNGSAALLFANVSFFGQEGSGSAEDAESDKNTL